MDQDNKEEAAPPYQQVSQPQSQPNTDAADRLERQERQERFVAFDSVPLFPFFTPFLFSIRKHPIILVPIR